MTRTFKRVHGDTVALGALTAVLIGCSPQGYIHWVDAGPAQDGGQCTWFAPCTPANACHTGQVLCTDAGPQCQDKEKTVADGTSCEDGGVCYLGSCASCGTTCTRYDQPCSAAQVSCTDPSVCVFTGRPAPDLTPCSSDGKICVESTCQSCSTMTECIPTDNCHTGYLTCGPAVCHDTGQMGPDGRDCGAEGVCHSGACAPTPYSLTITSGDQQFAYTDEALPDAGVLLLADSKGVPLPAAALNVTPPPGAAAEPLQVTTAADGTVGVEARVGRAPGPNAFLVSGPGGARATLHATSVAPPDGTIFGVVNDDEIGGDTPEGPASTHRIESPGGVAVASDGTLYYSDLYNCRIEAVSPAGEVSEVIGTGGQYNCGFSTAGGPAATIQLQTPSFLALDDTETVLFVSDTGNDLVRRVDLTSGQVSAYAGGGTQAQAPYGDGGKATNASLSAPAWLGWGADGQGGHQLYIADSNRGAMRYVDAQGIIHTMSLPSSGGHCAATTLAVSSCAFGCSIAWLPSGGMYLSASLCGTAFGSSSDTNATPGIAYMAPDGTWSAVAGFLGGSTDDSIPAVQATFYETPLIVADPAGNLLLDIRYEHRVRRIDAVTGDILTIAGETHSGTYGRYVPAVLSLLSSPDAIALDSQLNLYIADSGNSAVREIWHAGSL